MAKKKLLLSVYKQQMLFLKKKKFFSIPIKQDASASVLKKKQACVNFRMYLNKCNIVFMQLFSCDTDFVGSTYLSSPTIQMAEPLISNFAAQTAFASPKMSYATIPPQPLASDGSVQRTICITYFDPSIPRQLLLSYEDDYRLVSAFYRTYMDRNQQIRPVYVSEIRFLTFVLANAKWDIQSSIHQNLLSVYGRFFSNSFHTVDSFYLINLVSISAVFSFYLSYLISFEESFFFRDELFGDTGISTTDFIDDVKEDFSSEFYEDDPLYPSSINPLVELKLKKLFQLVFSESVVFSMSLREIRRQKEYLKKEFQFQVKTALLNRRVSLVDAFFFEIISCQVDLEKMYWYSFIPLTESLVLVDNTENEFFPSFHMAQLFLYTSISLALNKNFLLFLNMHMFFTNGLYIGLNKFVTSFLLKSYKLMLFFGAHSVLFKSHVASISFDTFSNTSVLAHYLPHRFINFLTFVNRWPCIPISGTCLFFLYKSTINVSCLKIEDWYEQEEGVMEFLYDLHLFKARPQFLIDQEIEITDYFQYIYLDVFYYYDLMEVKLEKEGYFSYRTCMNPEYSYWILKTYHIGGDPMDWRWKHVLERSWWKDPEDLMPILECYWKPRKLFFRWFIFYDWKDFFVVPFFWLAVVVSPNWRKMDSNPHMNLPVPSIMPRSFMRYSMRQTQLYSNNFFFVRKNELPMYESHLFKQAPLLYLDWDRYCLNNLVDSSYTSLDYWGYGNKLVNGSRLLAVKPIASTDDTRIGFFHLLMNDAFNSVAPKLISTLANQNHMHPMDFRASRWYLNYFYKKKEFYFRPRIPSRVARVFKTPFHGHHDQEADHLSYHNLFSHPSIYKQYPTRLIRWVRLCFFHWIRKQKLIFYEYFIWQKQQWRWKKYLRIKIYNLPTFEGGSSRKKLKRFFFLSFERWDVKDQFVRLRRYSYKQRPWKQLFWGLYRDYAVPTRRIRRYMRRHYISRLFSSDQQKRNYKKKLRHIWSRYNHYGEERLPFYTIWHRPKIKRLYVNWLKHPFTATFHKRYHDLVNGLFLTNWNKSDYYYYPLFERMHMFKCGVVYGANFPYLEKLLPARTLTWFDRFSFSIFGVSHLSNEFFFVASKLFTSSWFYLF